MHISLHWGPLRQILVNLQNVAISFSQLPEHLHYWKSINMSKEAFMDICFKRKNNYEIIDNPHFLNYTDT